MSRSARSRSPIQNEPTTSEEMSRSARSRSPIQNVPTTSEDSDMASGRSRSPCLKKITELHPDKSVGENWPVEGKILIPKSKAIKWGYQVSKNGLEYFNVVLEDESGKIEMIAFGSKFSEAYGERLKRTKKVRINKADLEEKDEDFKYILGHDYQIILNEKTKLDIVEAKEMSRSARSRVPKQNDATPREESRRNGDREGSNLKKENRTQTNEREGSNLKKENRTQTNEREGSNIKKETITQTMEAKLEQNDEITFESERMFEDGKNKKNLDGGASLITKVPAIKELSMATGSSRASCVKKISNLSKDNADERNWPVEGKIIFLEHSEMRCGRRTSKDGEMEYFRAVLEDESGRIDLIAFGSNFIDVYEPQLKENERIRITKGKLQDKPKALQYILGHPYQIILNRYTKLETTQAKGTGHHLGQGDQENGSGDGLTILYRREGSNVNKQNELETNKAEMRKDNEKNIENERKVVAFTESNKEKENNLERNDGGNRELAEMEAPNTSSDRHMFQKSSDDNLTEANMQKLTNMMSSVGAVVTSTREILGTCFCINLDIFNQTPLVMTAFHVIKNLEPPVKVTFTDLCEVCDADIYICIEPLDVAFLKISDGEKMPEALIALWDERIISKVVLIGYGNSAKPQVKGFEPPCDVITKTSEFIRSLKEFANNMAKDCKLPLSGGYDPIELEHTMLINCWQQHGASGAPLISISNSGNLEVEGVLTHGLPTFYWDLPEDIKSKFPGGYRREVGTKMSSIMKYLKAKFTTNQSIP